MPCKEENGACFILRKQIWEIWASLLTVSTIATPWRVANRRCVIPYNIRTTMDTSNLKVREFIVRIHVLHGSQSLDIKRPVSDQHTSPTWWFELGVPCWSIILHVQDVASRWSFTRLNNTSMYTGEGKVLCTSGSSREDWEQQEDQEADDIFREHFEQWWRWMLYVMSWEWSLVIPSTAHWEASPSWGAERMLMRLCRAQNVHISVKVAVEKGREKKKNFWYPFVKLKWIPYLSCSTFQSKATWKFGIKKSRTGSCSLDYWNTRTARGDTSRHRGGVLEILLAFKVQ